MGRDIWLGTTKVSWPIISTFDWDQSLEGSPFFPIVLVGWFHIGCARPAWVEPIGPLAMRVLGSGRQGTAIDPLSPTSTFMHNRGSRDRVFLQHQPY